MAQSTSAMFLVKKRLIEWGMWSYHVETMGLSYSGESVFAQLAREQGGLGTNSTVFHEQVEEMDALIEHMVVSGKDLQDRLAWGKVVRIHYTRFKEPISSKIQLSHFSKPTYYRYLNEAHEWLSETL